MSAPTHAGQVQSTLPSQGPGRTTILLVATSGLVMVLVLGGVAAWSWFGEIQSQVQVAQPAALAWSAESVHALIDHARASVERLADDLVLEDPGLQQRLEELSARVPVFSGIVAIDPEGRLLAAAGDPTALAPIVDLLETEGAMKAGLSRAMAAADLRRRLTEVKANGVQVIEFESQLLPLASVSMPGHGWILGLISPDGLAAALHVDLLEAGGIQLADAQGRILASAGRSVGDTISKEWIHAVAEPRLSAPWGRNDAWTVRSAMPVGVLDLTLVAHQPSYRAFEPMFGSAAKMAIAGVVMLAICVLLASLVAKQQSARLQVLLDGFRAVTCSDPQAQLPDEECGGQIGLLYRAFNAMVARVETERAERDARIAAMSKQNVGFQKQHELLAKLSNTDGLTQLYNHRYFQDQLTREIKRLSRTGGRLSMLIIDVDNFKQLNDTHGHAAGDEVLAQLAGILKESIRETDLLARYGGEEFVVVTFGTSAAGAEHLAEKLRTRVTESSFMVDESKRPRSVTVSIGVAEFKKSKMELFAAADAALYRAKAAGKNCVVVADDADRRVATG